MEALLSRKHSLSRVYSGRPRKEQQGTQNQGPSNVVPLVGFVRRLDCCRLAVLVFDVYDYMLLITLLIHWFISFVNSFHGKYL